MKRKKRAEWLGRMDSLTDPGGVGGDIKKKAPSPSFEVT